MPAVICKANLRAVESRAWKNVPEKDGLLAGVLCCEAVARRGKSLGEELAALSNQLGSFYPEWQNFRLTPEGKAKFTEKLKSDPRKFCGHAIDKVVSTGGLKLVFSDGSWVCYWLSGTEPGCASTPKRAAGRAWKN